MSQKLLGEIRDEKGRLAIIVRDNGMVCFFRYQDMTDNMKECVKEFYNAMAEEGVIIQDEHGKNLEDIQTFLNFHENEGSGKNDVCG